MAVGNLEEEARWVFKNNQCYHYNLYGIPIILNKLPNVKTNTYLSWQIKPKQTKIFIECLSDMVIAHGGKDSRDICRKSIILSMLSVILRMFV